MTFDERALLPSQIANLRDTGGLRAGSRTVRPRVLLRSSALARLPPATLDTLTVLLGPGNYLDLRTDEEVDRDGGAETLAERGWKWRRFPLADRLVGVEGDQAARLRTLMPTYLDTVDAVASEILLGGPNVVACSLGKDRTGVVIALLLRRAAVDRAEIVADYALSTVGVGRSRHLLPARWRDPAKSVRPVTADECATLLRLYDEYTGGTFCAQVREYLTKSRPASDQE